MHAEQWHHRVADGEPSQAGRTGDNAAVKREHAQRGTVLVDDENTIAHARFLRHLAFGRHAPSTGAVVRNGAAPCRTGHETHWQLRRRDFGNHGERVALRERLLHGEWTGQCVDAATRRTGVAIAAGECGYDAGSEQDVGQADHGGI